MQVSCTGGSGPVDVTVNQYPPETPYPVAAGSGPQLVVCDGRSRSVAVTVVGFGFDAGQARATATLVAPLGSPKTKTASRQILIRVVRRRHARGTGPGAARRAPFSVCGQLPRLTCARRRGPVR